jgi:hypothetical protein
MPFVGITFLTGSTYEPIPADPLSQLLSKAPTDVHLSIGLKCHDVPFFIRLITKSIAGNIDTSSLEPVFMRSFAFQEEQLRTAPGGSNGFLCGEELTGADMMMSFPLELCKEKAGLNRMSFR